MTEIVLPVELFVLADLLEHPPQNAGQLARAGIGSTCLQEGIEDDIAAEHYRLLTHELIPAAAFFLDSKSMLGGEVSLRVYAIMTKHGFEPDTSSVSADHLSNELRFLAHLLLKRDIAAADSFVRGHLFSWLPLLLAHLSSSDTEFFAELSMAIERAVLSLGSDEADPEHVLTPTQIDLDGQGTDLAAIAQFFATTGRCGFFVSRARLASEARRLRLPTGFGSRARTIEGLFRSASRYDSLGSVCDFFDSEVGCALDLWHEWALKGAGSWPNQWLRRLDKTSRVIESLRQASS